jgi:hypothetical protein
MLEHVWGLELPRNTKSRLCLTEGWFPCVQTETSLVDRVVTLHQQPGLSALVLIVRIAQLTMTYAVITPHAVQ